MNENNTAILIVLAFIRRHRAALLISFFIGCVVWFLSTHAIIKVQVSNMVGDTKVVLSRSGDGWESSQETKSGSVWKIVRSGRYEVGVYGESGGGWTTIKTSRFLIPSTANIDMQPEQTREFIGNNPSGCANTEGTVLVSYDCEGAIDSIKIHVAATTSTPTYTLPVKNTPPGIVIGVIYEANVMRVLAIVGDDAPLTAIYDLDTTTGNLSNERLLSELPEDRLFHMIRFDGGYLLYDEELHSLWRYGQGEVEPLNLPEPSDDSLTAYKISAQNGIITRVFTEDSGNDIDAPSDESDSLSSGVVLVADGDNTKEFSFDIPIVAALPCGTQKLCIVTTENEATNKLVVFDVSSDKPKNLYSMEGVTDARIIGDELVIARDNGIWALDPNASTGHLSYQMGDYEFCGFGGTVAINYICIREGSSSFGLKLESGIDNTIDKKLVKILNDDGIERVSAYKNRIYVTPTLGLVQGVNGFEYDPGEKQKAAEKIQELIKKYGIDTTKYTVINLRG